MRNNRVGVRGSAALDIQLVRNDALVLTVLGTIDVNVGGKVDAADVQTGINSAPGKALKGV